MKHDEQSARLREAFASFAEEAAPRPDCPAPERLWDAVGGRLAASEAREIVDHTASCPSCAEAWRLARKLRESAPRGQLAPGDVATGMRRWRWAAIAAAAIVLTLVALPQWRTEPTGGPPAELRGREAEIIHSLLDEGEALPRGEFRLRWSTAPDAALQFRVRVATEELQIIARARGLVEAEYLVPEEALAPIRTGERILWQVEAQLQEGDWVVSRAFVARVE